MLNITMKNKISYKNFEIIAHEGYAVMKWFFGRACQFLNNSEQYIYTGTMSSTWTLIS